MTIFVKNLGMKKVLFLSHVPPFPEIGGDRVRIAQSLRLLSEICEVDVAFLSHHRTEQSVKAYLPAIRDERCFYVPRRRRYMRILKTLFNRRPMVANHFCDKSLMRHVHAVAGNYDAVFCASAVMAQYAVGARRRILDMTDSLTMNYRHAAEASCGMRRLLYNIDAARMERYERLCVETFDAVLYISANDAAYVPGGRKFVVGNAVNAVAPDKHCLYLPDSKTVLFVGKMDYEPNVLAVEFFAREVLPLVRRNEPACRFVIAGASPSERVRALDSLDGVDVTGFVPSLTPYYARAALVVAPMLSGSGIQNKILQAMAYGCPVLTTPKGFEGIERLADALRVIQPEASPWTDAVGSMLADASGREELGRAAARRVQEEFGPEKIRAEFRKAVCGCVDS